MGETSSERVAVSLLDERPLSPDERAAIADEARPGVWIEEELRRDEVNSPREEARYATIRRGDGRPLDQAQTDQLIVLELMRAMSEWRPMIRELLAPGQIAPTWQVNVAGATAEAQRGGIHSDPLVRLLAFRAWGDRDRRWFERQEDRKRLAIEKVNEMIALGMLVVPR